MMISDKPSRLIFVFFALVAVLVGTLSLLGVRPLNNRAIEIALGSASVVAGLALISLTLRRNPGAVRRRSGR